MKRIVAIVVLSGALVGCSNNHAPNADKPCLKWYVWANRRNKDIEKFCLQREGDPAPTVIESKIYGGG